MLQNRRTKDQKINVAQVVYASTKAAFMIPMFRELYKRKLKAVIWVNTIEYELNILEYILRWLMYGYLRLDGSTPPEKRAAIIHNFTENPNYLFFIATMRTGSDSINLTASHLNIFWSTDWNPSVNAQATSRLVRIGQPKSVSSLILVATTDEEMERWKHVQQKAKLNEYALKAITDPTIARDCFEIIEQKICQTKELQFYVETTLNIYNTVVFLLDGGYGPHNEINIFHISRCMYQCPIYCQQYQVCGRFCVKLHILQLGYEQVVPFELQFGENDKTSLSGLNIELSNLTTAVLNPAISKLNNPIEVNNTPLKLSVIQDKDMSLLVDEITRDVRYTMLDTHVECSMLVDPNINDICTAVTLPKGNLQNMELFSSFRTSIDTRKTAPCVIRWIVLDNAGNQGDHFARIFGLPSLIFTLPEYLRNNRSMIQRFHSVDSNIPVILMTRRNEHEYSFENITVCHCLKIENEKSQHTHTLLDEDSVHNHLKDVILVVETIGCSDLSSMGKHSTKYDNSLGTGIHNKYLVELETVWSKFAPLSIRHGESSFRLATDLGSTIIEQMATAAMKRGRYFHCNRYNAFYNGGPCSISATRN